MKLLNVEVVLNRDKDSQQAAHKPEIAKELDDMATSYAILSHRWGTEVSYEEMIGLMKMEEQEREEIRKRDGHQKIIKSCEQATKDGYRWLWIDTCCIDKRSSSELSEAINSMYRWYQNAGVCYAYLSDVKELAIPAEKNDKFHQSNGWPEWFVRGWTLQELIAPKQVEFFNKDWVSIGNKQRFAPTLENITGIPLEVLTDGLAVSRVCVAQIMSWAAKRKTTRVEDRAYSLMGLLGVNMPMLYGEGKKAFQRLQLEILRTSSDQSVFAWDRYRPRTGSVLAEDPSDFEMSGYIRKVEPADYGDKLLEYIEEEKLGDPRGNDILGWNRRTHRRKLAALRDAANSQQCRTFTVSNAGIQVFLPVLPFPDSPAHFRVILACSFYDRKLIPIDFAPSEDYRKQDIDTELYPEFKTLHLAYHQDVSEKCREFTVDDKHASYHGFTRCGTHDGTICGENAAVSSLTADFIIPISSDGCICIVYANNDTGSRFAVGLGNYLGQGWVHVVSDGCSPTRQESWDGFGEGAFDQMWTTRAEHARNLPKPERSYRICDLDPRGLLH
ncbi:heterokaryon incompatibility protein-domain-containing protein [Pisolithus marmoratus]|nr:heterokaryon incompatibility protein-domain-containing protein [Pisolithus marmoratus]